MTWNPPPPPPPPAQEDGGGEFYPALVDLTFSPKPGGLGKWEV